MSNLRSWFDLVCDLPADQRATTLRDAGADAAMIADVLSLLDAEAGTHARARGPLAELAAAWVETELKAGDVLGSWRLLREIGQGGMGAVFLAERADGHFDQQAAVKLMRGRADVDAAARFARERQLLAHLQHPQIARLLDGGATPEQQPYLVMEYIEGAPIDQWCRQQHASLDTRLRLFASICSAVQFAHQQLIVHCDLKPANVLVRDDGVPVLLDFGIARAIDAHASTTPAEAPSMTAADDDQHNALTPMTPRYASPEQLRGETPGLATDIHALGLMLYELIADTPPPRERSERAPVPSTTPVAVPWRRQLAGDLDAIVAQACALEPARRYASAAALADEITHIIEHRPIQARRHNATYVFARLLRRRWPVFVVAAVVLALAAGFTWRTMQAEQRARMEALTAQQATDFMVSVFAASDSNVNKLSSGELTARAVLDAGRARIDSELIDQPAVRARLLESLGHAYRHMNRGTIAVPLLQQAAALNLSDAVDDPVAAARCLEAQTNAMANGEFPAADTVRVALQSLQVSRQVSAPESQQMANAWMVLSLAYNRNGNYDDALAAAQTSLELNEQLDGPDRRLPQAHSNLAMIHSNRGQQDIALRHITTAIELTDPETVGESMRRRTQAIIRQRLGDWAGAMTAFERALDLAVARHGEHGAFAIEYRRGLGRVLTDHGRYPQAFAWFERALADEIAATGADSSEALSVRQDIAVARVAAGIATSTVDELDTVHARRLQDFGVDDPRTLSAAAASASARLLAGLADANTRALLDDVLARWQTRSPQGSMPARQAMLLLAQWHLQRAGAPAAASLLDEVERNPQLIEAVHKPQIAALRAWIARSTGDLADALHWDERAFALHRQWYGDAHPKTAVSALILARDLRRQGARERAETLLRAWQPRLVEFPSASIHRNSVPDA